VVANQRISLSREVALLATGIYGAFVSKNERDFKSAQQPPGSDYTRRGPLAREDLRFRHDPIQKPEVRR